MSHTPGVGAGGREAGGEQGGGASRGRPRAGVRAARSNSRNSETVLTLKQGRLMAQIIQPRPDSGLGFMVQVL